MTDSVVKRGMLVRTKRITTLALSVCLLGCLGIPEQATAVNNFELTRYLGTWHEIARLDHRFERGLSHVTAQYTLREDGGVRVVNKGFNTRENTWSIAEGKAFFIGAEDQGRLKVSFFGPFYGAYNIVELDPEYQYSMVIGPNTKYLWILARSPDLDPSIRKRLIERASQLGFKVDDLIFPTHGDADTMSTSPKTSNARDALPSTHDLSIDSDTGRQLSLLLQASAWRRINDGVMGGISSSDVRDARHGLTFQGTLRLENNGGFASIRRPLDAAVTGATHVEVRARGDGREYQLRLRETDAWDGVAWRHPFTTSETWQTHRLRLSDFEPVYRGRVLQYKQPLQSRPLGQIGFMLADGTPGSFTLDVNDMRFVF